MPNLFRSSVLSGGRRYAKIDISTQVLLTVLQNNSPLAVFTVLDCPSWPKWKIADSPKVLDRLGDDSDPILFFDVECSIWVECPLSYPHTPKTDGYLLLRRAGVMCRDFDKYLQLATQKLPTSRTYLTKTLKNKGKQKEIKALSSDSEIEIIEGPIPGTLQYFLFFVLILIIDLGQSKWNKPESSSTPSPPSKRRLSISESSQSPTPVTVQNDALYSSESSRSPTPIARLIKSPTPSQQSLPWYAGLYAVDMVKAFQKMADKKLGKNYAERFTSAFESLPPPRSSYYDQVKRWSQAPQRVRDEALEAGRTQEALWANFVRNNSLRR